MGADAVFVHINIGSGTESDQLSFLGCVSEHCDFWGMPLVAMMYPRGKGIANPNDVEVVAHAARAGAELGADIIKTNYTGNIETFRRVVEGCPVPVVVAGGPKTETDMQFLEMIEGAMKGGARGVAIGRNVFQADDPVKMTMALSAIVNQGKSAKEAIQILK